VLAKVTRDRIMVALDAEFPQYGSPSTRATARRCTTPR
jgi:ribonuclease HII